MKKWTPKQIKALADRYNREGVTLRFVEGKDVVYLQAHTLSMYHTIEKNMEDVANDPSIPYTIEFEKYPSDWEIRMEVK